MLVDLNQKYGVRQQENTMKFREGKFYAHPSGMIMAVLGRLNTTMWGNDALIAEVIRPTSIDGKEIEAVVELVALNENIKRAAMFNRGDWKKINRKKWEKAFE